MLQSELHTTRPVLSTSKTGVQGHQHCHGAVALTALTGPDPPPHGLPLPVAQDPTAAHPGPSSCPSKAGGCQSDIPAWPWPCFTTMSPPEGLDLG